MNTELKYATAAHAKLQHPSQSNTNSNGHSHADHSEVNVGEVERQASLIGGTVLAVCGLLRGSLPGLALAAIGGALIWRGHIGHCEIYHAMGYSSADGSEELVEFCQSG